MKRLTIPYPAIKSEVSISSPNATDLSTAIALVNEIKTDFNILVVDLNNVIEVLNKTLETFRRIER